MMEGTIKKRSFLLLRPERHLILFSDGSLAYFKLSKSQPHQLKAFMTRADIKKIVLEGNKLELTTRKKTFHFYFKDSALAQQWAHAFKLTCNN
jgi:hypothetical protein